MTSSDLHSAVIKKYSLLYVPSRIVGVSNLTSSSSPTAPGVKLVTVKETEPVSPAASNPVNDYSAEDVPVGSPTTEQRVPSVS